MKVSSLIVLLFASAGAAPAPQDDAAPVPKRELADELPPLQASPGPASSICSTFNEYVGSMCTCVDASKAATMTCQVSVDGYLTFGARLIIDICGTPNFAFYYDAGDGYTLGEQFGLPYTDQIPIPGVSADIPLVGTIGAVGEVRLP
jgi:hypothetical protein